MAYTVFISHASSDRWVAAQIGKEISDAGADHFLDSHVVETGDQLDDEIRNALRKADEFLVLITPAALGRPYVWLEMGAAWGQDKRIVGVLYGVTTNELAERDGTPAFLTGTVLCDINDLGRYLEELRQRIPDG